MGSLLQPWPELRTAKTLCWWLQHLPASPNHPLADITPTHARHGTRCSSCRDHLYSDTAASSEQQCLSPMLPQPRHQGSSEPLKTPREQARGDVGGSRGLLCPHQEYLSMRLGGMTHCARAGPRRASQKPTGRQQKDQGGHSSWSGKGGGRGQLMALPSQSPLMGPWLQVGCQCPSPGGWSRLSPPLQWGTCLSHSPRPAPSPVVQGRHRYSTQAGPRRPLTLP